MENRMDSLTSEIYADSSDIDFSEDIIPQTSIETAQSIFAQPEYPSQLGSPDRYFVAEYQGTYPENRWSPKSSKFGWTRRIQNGTKKYHNAIDLYAPHGTPLIAIVDGEVTMKPQLKAESIGHRLWLSFNINNKPFRFVYGHLDRFEGKSRSVKRGDIIGYSGCSGNTLKCRQANKCGLVSDHVHLILFDDIKEKSINPHNLINWSIRYWDDELNTPCSELPVATKQYSAMSALD